MNAPVESLPVVSSYASTLSEVLAGVLSVPCADKSRRVWAWPVCDLLVTLAEANFLVVSVNDGEENIKCAGNIGKAVETVCSVDDSSIYVSRYGGRAFHIYIVLGNGCYDLVNDYSLREDEHGKALDVLLSAWSDKWEGVDCPTRGLVELVMGGGLAGLAPSAAAVVPLTLSAPGVEAIWARRPGVEYVWAGPYRPYVDGDGEAGLELATYCHLPCGCRVVGNGTLPHPLTVQQCAKHGYEVRPIEVKDVVEAAAQLMRSHAEAVEELQDKNAGAFFGKTFQLLPDSGFKFLPASAPVEVPDVVGDFESEDSAASAPVAPRPARAAVVAAPAPSGDAAELLAVTKSFMQCVPEFRSRIMGIARVAGKPWLDVYKMWRVYSEANYDQSALVSEFITAKLPELGGNLAALEAAERGELGIAA